MIRLSSEIYKIKAIKKKTRAAGFAELQVGDAIRFSLDLSNTTNYGAGNYATDIMIYDLKRGSYIHKTQSQLVNILRNSFELEAVPQPSAGDVLEELFDVVQDMRESGDTDLRTVLHQIDRLSRGTQS